MVCHAPMIPLNVTTEAVTRFPTKTATRASCQESPTAMRDAPIRQLLMEKASDIQYATKAHCYTSICQRQDFRTKKQPYLELPNSSVLSYRFPCLLMCRDRVEVSVTPFRAWRRILAFLNGQEDVMLESSP